MYFEICNVQIVFSNNDSFNVSIFGHFFDLAFLGGIPLLLKTFKGHSIVTDFHFYLHNTT